MDNATDQLAREQLKRRRNDILVQIKQQIRHLEEHEIDRRTSEIEHLNDSAQMFRAVRELTSSRPSKLVIKNASGEIVGQPEEAAEIVAKHFASLFHSSQVEPLNANVTNAPLHSPITTKEVSQAVAKLNNGRAVGPDGVPGELLKYGGLLLHKYMADIYNKMFERGENLELGSGTLISLQKPGKPPGVLSSLRPIVLLNSLRKTLSLITLQRIRPAVENFLSKSQSGFRQYRSTSDAVWAHKWMIARVMKVREEIHILGIDMSRAFDTINRSKLLNELHNIIDADSWRLVYSLLDKTTLQAKIGHALSAPIETNIGAPQGDSLSPVLFTIYLELAMREVRATCPRPPEDTTIPTEILYADDTDFISQVREVITNIEAQSEPILKNWDLTVNRDKTEHTTLKREEKTTIEAWRNTKKLGTLLGDTEEMRRRKQLASIAFHDLKRIWSRKKNNKIGVARRLRLYNAYIMPVLTYNSCTWALTRSEIDELDAFRRKQLRTVIGVYYPRRISNAALYNMCGCTTELYYVIRGARWRMLGHVLRMHEDTPAKRAMLHFFDARTSGAFLGRPRTTLQTALGQDLQEAASHPHLKQYDLPKQFKNGSDLIRLEEIAKERTEWRSIVANMQVPPPPRQRMDRPRRCE